MKKRKSVNLIPLLDIILLILFIFMINVDTGTRDKARGYDQIKQTLEVKTKVFNEELSRSRQEIEKLIAENSGLRKEISQLELESEKLKEISKKIASRDEVRKSLVRENANLIDTNNSLNEQLENIKNRLNDRRQELSELHKQLENQEELKSRVVESEQKLEHQKNHLLLVENEKKNLSERLTETEKRLITLEHKLERARVEENSLRLDVAKLKAMLDRAAVEQETVQKNNYTLQEKLKKLKTENLKLREETTRNRKNQNQDWQAVMEKQRKLEARLQSFSNKEKRDFTESGDRKALVDFAKNYFWIITIHLGQEDDDTGRQTLKIFDDRNNDSFSSRPEGTEEIFVRLQRFIKNHSAGGRDTSRVVVKIKSHTMASGAVLQWTKNAVARGNWQTFSVEFIGE